MVVLWLLVGCELTPEQMCAGRGDLGMTLGEGTGSDFIALETGDEVWVTEAPQGGNGMQVRAHTAGLVTNGLIDVTMWSEVDGAEGEAFTVEGVNLYCTDSGEGLFWGAVVPLDPTDFGEREQIEPLDEADATLFVEATDSDGDVALGELDVVLRIRDED